jgi:predicted lipid-binding transport protein (Tim44 family)
LRISLACLLGLYFLFSSAPDVQAHPIVSSVIVPPALTDDDNYHPQVLRRGGSFRSPRSGYTPGYGNGRRAPGAANPGARTPAAPANRFGGFLGGMFGGLLAGSLLGSLLNPLGFGGTGGISMIGLLFWAVIIYFVVRFVRRRFI